MVLALVVSHDLFPRPSETLTSRDVMTSQVRGYWSVSVIIAQSGTASDGTAGAEVGKNAWLSHPPVPILPIEWVARGGVASMQPTILVGSVFLV